jgi:putative acetyltransferase
LPGKYAVPEGRILLGWEDENLAGGIALRPLESGTCEMKRLYVRPDWRGKGLGRRLAEQSVEAAREIGYTAMRLDTEKRLTAAIALYQNMGFAEIGQYYDNPLADILYMELDLTT